MANDKIWTGTYYLAFNGIPEVEDDRGAQQVYKITVFNGGDLSEGMLAGVVLDEFYHDYGVEVHVFHASLFREDGTEVFEAEDYDRENPPCGPDICIDPLDETETIISMVDRLAEDAGLQPLDAPKDTHAAARSVVDALEARYELDIHSEERLTQILEHTLSVAQGEYLGGAQKSDIDRIACLGHFFARSGASPADDPEGFKERLAPTIWAALSDFHIKKDNLPPVAAALIEEIGCAIVRDRAAALDWVLEEEGPPHT